MPYMARNCSSAYAGKSAFDVIRMYAYVIKAPTTPRMRRIPQYFSTMSIRIAAIPATTIISKKKLQARVIKKLLVYCFLITVAFFDTFNIVLISVADKTPSKKLNPNMTDFIPGRSNPSKCISA